MGILDALFGPKEIKTEQTPQYPDEFKELAQLLGRLTPGLVGRPQVPYLGMRYAPPSPMQQMAMGRAFEVGTASDGPVWSPMGRRTSYMGGSQAQGGGFNPVPYNQPQQQQPQQYARGGLAQALGRRR